MALNHLFTPMSALRSASFMTSRTIRQPKLLNLNSIKLFHSSRIALTSITETLKTDHRKLEEQYDNIKSAKNADEQTRWQNQFVWQLARHSVAEELIVYPAFEKHCGSEGKEKADKDRAEHHKVKEQLKAFQNMKCSDPKFIPTLDSLMKDLKHHIEEEEHEDLPFLEKFLVQDESDSLSRYFDRTKALVPSRSHPSAGENPLFEGALGLMIAPIDHIADIMRKFPDEKISPNPSTK